MTEIITSTTAATTQIPFGNVVHTEFVSNDTAATCEFFGNVFGLNFENFPGPTGDYFTFGSQEFGIGGAVLGVGENMPTPVSTPYFGVENLDTVLGLVEANGGNIVVPKTAVPNMGWFSWFTIPGVLTIAAWQNDVNATVQRLN
jgi:predicted enzyme related to lactoylglutathione lyase